MPQMEVMLRFMEHEIKQKSQFLPFVETGIVCRFVLVPKLQLFYNTYKQNTVYNLGLYQKIL